MRIKQRFSKPVMSAAKSRIIRVAALLVVLPTVGCTTHAERRVHAEQHWNQVRARVKYQLARQQFERGNTETSIETVNEAIAIDDSPADQFLLLARCYMEKGKFVSALHAAKQAKRCAPQEAEVEYTLGVIAERTDQLESALEHYRRARSQDENAVDYLVAEAECLAALGRAEEAISQVSRNLGRFDSDGTLEMLLAQMGLLVGDKEMSLRNLRLAMERSGCGSAHMEGAGSCASLIEEYGWLLSDTGRYTEAVAILHPYVSAGRDIPRLVVNALCSGYLATGRAGEAKQILRDQVRRRPGNTKSWMLLVQASILTDDWITARRSTDRLERLVPHNAQAHLLHGFVCWKQNDLQEAERSLQRALSIDPDDAIAHCLIGQVLEESGRRATAKEHYQTSLQIDPQYACAGHLSGPPLPPVPELSSSVPDQEGELP